MLKQASPALGVYVHVLEDDESAIATEEKEDNEKINVDVAVIGNDIIARWPSVLIAPVGTFGVLAELQMKYSIEKIIVLSLQNLKTN